MLAAVSACVLGFMGGFRHAFEPDHLAAVTTLVAGQRSARTTVRYAAAWGAGHAAMLLLVGGALAVLRAELPALANDTFELIVAVVLVLLGVRGIVQAVRLGRGGAPFAHAHDGATHTHGGVSDHVHVRGIALSRLPFIVGLFHGLAGSGALALLVMANQPSTAFALAFISIYALAAALGMSVLAGVLGWPLARVARSERAMKVLVGTSAVASLGIGIWWAALAVSRIAT